MTDKSRFAILPFFRALALISIAPSCFAYAANFSITPNGTLPTQVSPGGSVSANYTLTNMTNSTRNGYSVVGLPSTVTQDTSPGNCPASIDLAAGASCNLKFTITGEVNSTFAICKGNSCTTETDPLVVNVVTPSEFRVASGGYCTLAGCFPLLAQSTTGTWSYPSTILSNFPVTPSYITPFFYANSCSGSICTAAGADDEGVNPLLAVTTDSGVTWTYPIGSTGTWPSDISNNTGAFYGTSCSGNWCIAAGYYASTDNVQYPLLAQSIDGGVTWNYAIDSSNNPPPTLFLRGFFYDASCSGSLCIAAGTYEDNSDAIYYPLIEQSTNGGTSWSTAIDKNSGALPANYSNNGQFSSATCIGSICIAAGNYRASDNQVHPMLARTNDGGGTWTYIIDNTNGPQPANYGSNGLFTGTTCSGTICLASGFYTTLSSDQVPYLVRSDDLGITWTKVIDDMAGPQPTNYLGNGIFNSTSCSGTTCTVSGYYDATGSGINALLGQSTDSGATWNYVIDSTNPPPGYTANGRFDNTTCNSSGCFAVGTYTVMQTDYPLIAEQIGGGAWTYVVDNDLTTIPAGLISGEFDGSASASALKVEKNKKRKIIGKK